MPSNDDWKHLQLVPSDAVTLINIRAVYVIQLLVTIAGGTSENLKPMFNALGHTTTIQMLCDMDSCLLSFEGMLSCWQAALTDLLSCGRFDVKAVLKASDIKPVTSVAVRLCGAAGEDGDDQNKSKSTTSHTEISDDDAALFSWTELISYGSGDLIPAADELLCLQSTLRSRLLEKAREIEGDYRKRMCVYVEQTGHDGDDAAKRRRGHNNAGMMKTTILFKLNEKDEVLKSPTDANLLYYKLPKDLKLVFFGNVSHLAFGLAFVLKHVYLNMNMK